MLHFMALYLLRLVNKLHFCCNKKVIVCLPRGQGSTWPAAPCESWEGLCELCTFLSGGQSEGQRAPTPAGVLLFQDQTFFSSN